MLATHDKPNMYTTFNNGIDLNVFIWFIPLWNTASIPLFVLQIIHFFWKPSINNITTKCPNRFNIHFFHNANFFAVISLFIFLQQNIFISSSKLQNSLNTFTFGIQLALDRSGTPSIFLFLISVSFNSPCCSNSLFFSLFVLCTFFSKS